MAILRNEHGSDTGSHGGPSAVLHRSLHESFLKVTGSEGNYLHLENGQKILDASGGAAVACLGHNNKDIRKAVIDQMDKVSYVCTVFHSSDGSEDLCSLLIKGTEGKMEKAYIVSSGSEAAEAAMKMSRQYFVELEGPDSPRRRFISRNQSYHGTTLGSLGLGGHVARRKIYEPILSTEVSRVSPCYAYRGMRDNETTDAYVERLAKELDDEFQRLGPETVCAFVAEPVVGAALGCVPAVPGYFKAMRKVCDKYGALLILDEIMSGMGRTGYLHAWQSPLVDCPPDLQTVGKGLGGGYQPVAGLLLSPKVVRVLNKGTGTFANGHTYQAHPVACAAGAAVQKAIMKPGMMEHVRKLGDALERGLKERLEAHPQIGDIRGAGLFWGIEFVQDKTTKEPFDPSLLVANGINKLGLQEPFSIQIYPGNGTSDGVRGDHVLVAPAYNCTLQDIDLIVEKTAAVIADYFSDHVGEKSSAIQGKKEELYKPEDGSLLSTA